MKKPSTFCSLFLSSLFWVGCPAAAQTSSGLKSMTYVGCFTSGETLQDLGSYDYQSSGYCQKKCVELSKPVMGLRGGANCWCGDLVPVAANKVNDSQCDIPCTGYDKDMCGGDSTYMIFLTGTKPKVSTALPSSTATATTSTSSDASRTASPTVTTAQPTQTAAVSERPSATPDQQNSNGGTSAATKAGIAAGITVGIGLCALAAGLFFFLRLRKKHAVEAEYRRRAEIDRLAGGKPESASSISDSRLEPSVILHRRESDGSIADNQDYSRRILKVTNPDKR